MTPPFEFKITLDYRSKKLKVGSWGFVASVIKITIDYLPKYWKKCSLWLLLGVQSHKKVEQMLDIRVSFWEKDLAFVRGMEGWVLSICGRTESWAFVASFGIKIKIDYRPKNSKKMLGIIGVYWENINYPRGGNSEHLYLSPFGIDYRPNKLETAEYYKFISTKKSN